MTLTAAFRKLWPDALAGAVTFGVILACVGDASHAAGTSGQGLQNQLQAGTAPLLIALVIAMLVTLNMAFFRHLIRAYAIGEQKQAAVAAERSAPEGQS